MSYLSVCFSSCFRDNYQPGSIKSDKDYKLYKTSQRISKSILIFLTTVIVIYSIFS